MPSETKKHINWILVAIGLGFVLIITVSWIVEITGLFGLLHGLRSEDYFQELAIDTGLLILVAFPVLIIVNRLLLRLRYLEGLILVCSWCKQVHYQDEWMPYDKFRKIKYDANTSHGICHHCSRQMQIDREEIQAKRAKAISN